MKPIYVKKYNRKKRQKRAKHAWSNKTGNAKGNSCITAIWENRGENHHQDDVNVNEEKEQQILESRKNNDNEIPVFPVLEWNSHNNN